MTPYNFKSAASLDLSIIIVSFNTCEVLVDCLRSVYAHTVDLSFEVFVVDNDSKDGSADRIESEFTAVKLIRNSDNTGFSVANNQAIKMTKGRYVVLLNSDTLLIENCSFFIY